MIEIRRDLHGKIYHGHIGIFTKLREQIPNMDEAERRGLRYLLNRIRASEILVIKTEKSGRVCVVLWKNS